MKETHSRRLSDLVGEYGMEGVVKELHDMAVAAKDDESASILGSALEEFEELEDEAEFDEDEAEDDEDEAEQVEDEEE